MGSVTLDFIIVGQGIAGTQLAWHLLKQKQKVLLIDEHSGSRCSRVAAGLINPITGRRFSKSWMIDNLLPYAKEVYQTMEGELGKSLWFAMDMFRIIKSAEQENNWMLKQGDERYKAYLENSKKEKLDAPVRNPKGVFTVDKVYKVDGNALLEGFAQKWKKEGNLIEEPFDYNDLEIAQSGISYRGHSAKAIVFCEGYAMLNNPFFNSLPLVPNKGEALMLELPSLQQRTVLHNRGNLVWSQNQTFWMGATVKRHETSLHPTEENKAELLERAGEMVSSNLEVVEHKVGVRPTVKDIRPLIGQHPEHKNLWLFNGMGTKGYSLSPYFANQLTNHILYNKPLHKEVNILRWNEK